MKYSVIIPTYNEEKDIRECLVSLSKQSVRKEIEVVVVDDGSTDNTFSVVSKLQITNLKLQIYKQQHKGAGAARNFGVKKSDGEILVFLDADMTFETDFIENLVKPILKQKVPGTFSKEEYVSNWDNVWARCWNYNDNLSTKRRIPENYPDTQKVFRAIKRDLFIEAKGFSKQASYTDDYGIFEKTGIMAVVAPGAKYYHKNPDSLSEVYRQARWVSQREHKLGKIGFVAALMRVSLPITKLSGVYKAIKYKTWQFIVFKFVYNTGATEGIIDYMIRKKGVK